MFDMATTTTDILRLIASGAALAAALDHLEEGIQAFDQDRLTSGELRGLLRTVENVFGNMNGDWSKILGAVLQAQRAINARIEGVH